MPQAKYLLIGSSHAALEALRAIRLHDTAGSVAMITRDRHLPYSPTVLPYVVSGRSAPEQVTLRDESFFAANDALLLRDRTVVGLDPGARTVALANNEVWGYEKLLLATGATPVIPPISGLSDVPFHALRTLDDALELRHALGRARAAVVLGAGLIGMHAAENLVAAGVRTTVIECLPRVLAAYFEAEASARIERTFTRRGATLRLGRRVIVAERGDDGVTLRLDDGTSLDTDLLLVATGVRPALSYLVGAGIETEQGVLVDDRMRTSVPAVWAAGDIAQARDFYGRGAVMSGILPAAVEQGRTAGMDMAGDAAVKPYPGTVPLNTYRYFDHQALSVGLCVPDIGMEVANGDGPGYRRYIFAGNRLAGVAAVDAPLDVGVMWQLILRRVDLATVRDAFIARPVETGRRLMSELWR